MCYHYTVSYRLLMPAEGILRAVRALTFNTEDSRDFMLAVKSTTIRGSIP